MEQQVSVINTSDVTTLAGLDVVADSRKPALREQSFLHKSQLSFDKN